MSYQHTIQALRAHAIAYRCFMAMGALRKPGVEVHTLAAIKARTESDNMCTYGGDLIPRAMDWLTSNALATKRDDSYTFTIDGTLLHSMLVQEDAQRNAA